MEEEKRHGWCGGWWWARKKAPIEETKWESQSNLIYNN